MSELGIFTVKKNEGKAVAFIGCDHTSLIAMLYQEAAKTTGYDMEVYSPVDGEKLKCIGKISVSAVDDSREYLVATEKADTKRVPEGENGDWVVQSLVFSKETFTLEQAKAWILDNDEYGDYGVDETDTAYRFRQYDPESFTEFKTSTVAEGIAAVHGQIGQAESVEEAEKAISDSLAKHDAVRKINSSIMKQGVKILCGTASTTIAKSDEGEEVEEVEERYVLSMVLEPNDGNDGAVYQPDTQNDIYSAEDVRKACHTWMENYGAVDLMHNWRAIGKQDVRVLECFIAPVAFQLGDDTVQKGSWMLAIRVVNDELWQAVKDGDLGAYSIGGTANRVPLEQV